MEDIETKETKTDDGMDEIAVLRDKLAQCEKLRDEYLAGWQRQKADFLNYQKEETGRRAEWLKFANADLLLDILLALDSFDLALIQVESEKSKQGIQLIRAQLESILRKRGLEEIKALGEKFDPAIHEAIETVSAPDKTEDTVAEVVQRGYLLHDRVLRPAKVKVTIKQ
jgi:molecular chaperone GrpE